MRLTAFATFIFAGILAVPAFGAPASDAPDTATVMQTSSVAGSPVVAEAMPPAVDPAAAEPSNSLEEDGTPYCDEAEQDYNACVDYGGVGGCNAGDEACCAGYMASTYAYQECVMYYSEWEMCVMEMGEDYPLCIL